MVEDIDEQILKIIEEDFKSVSEIAEALDINRSRAFMRLEHLWKRQEVIKLRGKGEGCLSGGKYKINSLINDNIYI